MNPLDPYVLAKINGLALRAKLVAEGVLSGSHRSRHQGSSLEFVEHKEYTPGDDLRFIDWRAYARRDKFSIKCFEEDASIRGYLILDQSGSMNYRGSFKNRSLKIKLEQGLTKFQYAQILAASLAYLILHQKDKVGMAGLQQGLKNYVPPRSHWNHLHFLLKIMEEMEPKGQGLVAEGLNSLGLKVNRRGLIILFSDLLDLSPEWLNSLSRLCSRNHDVVLFHILDRWEIEFPFFDNTRFLDLESENNVVVNAKEIRKEYASEFNQYLEKTRGDCLREKIDYHLAITDTPPDRILSHFLMKRKAS